MDYLAYHFKVTPPQPGSEILMAMIAGLGFESFEQDDQGFTAYLQAAMADQANLGDLEFPDFTYTFKVERIKGRNWNQEWEKNFEPVLVGDQLRIRAPFHEPAKGASIEILIMPKMSFGTGHHQTTRLMCAKMIELDLKGAAVLDMGTGTGVLAILARKLGASRVLAIDIDAWSVENATENCIANKCTGIEVKEGDEKLLSAEGNFDVILANINRNVLKQHMPAYAGHLKDGGYLLMSGFFVTDRLEIESSANAHGLTLVDRSAENEWCQLRFRKGY